MAPRCAGGPTPIIAPGVLTSGGVATTPATSPSRMATRQFWRPPQAPDVSRARRNWVSDAASPAWMGRARTAW